MKLCVAFGVTPLFAVIVIGKVPPAVGVPASVAVPLLLLVNVTPAGNAPSSVIDIDALVGTPVVVTVKVPAWLIVKVVLFALVIVGAWFTVSVKLCVALGAMPLLAVIVIGYVPPVAGAGVPASVAVPSLLLVNVTPEGKAPSSVIDIEAPLGVPLVVTANVPGDPIWNATLFALVMAGGALTVSVKDCVALGVTPLLAVIVIGKVPPALGVPASVAVPLLLLVNVTPAGSAPVSVIAIAALVGNPVVVTVKVPATPVWNVTLFALVIAGAWFTLSVKLCVAFGAMPLLAVIVIG